MSLELPPINNELIKPTLIEILKDSVFKTGFKKVILGVSGGVDSALSLALCVKAFGAENVKALMIPYSSSSPTSLEHASCLIKDLGVSYEIVDISSMVDSYFVLRAKVEDSMDKLRKANLIARTRMITLYDLSAKGSALVIGTSNKTESLLGYSTLWGDMASAVNPIGDLYKNQVFSLAKYLGVPKMILEKAPSADLWENQTDEEELEFSYDMADRILYARVDKEMPANFIKTQLKLMGENPDLHDKVWTRVISTSYKRRMPISAKISHSTIDREFKFPRDLSL